MWLSLFNSYAERRPNPEPGQSIFGLTGRIRHGTSRSRVSRLSAVVLSACRPCHWARPEAGLRPGVSRVAASHSTLLRRLPSAFGSYTSQLQYGTKLFPLFHSEVRTLSFPTLLQYHISTLKILLQYETSSRIFVLSQKNCNIMSRPKSFKLIYCAIKFRCQQ